MTFRHPYITPAKGQASLRSTPDSTQATNLQLFKNPIPFSQTDWPRVQSVRYHLPDVTHIDILLYPAVTPPTPFNQLDWTKNSFGNWPTPVQYPNIVLKTVVVQSPIIPLDWGKTGNIPDFLLSGLVQTNINLFTNPIPFNQQSWPSVNSVKSAPPQPQQLNILIPIPFLLQDFSTSRIIPDWLPPPQYPNIALGTAVVQFPFYTQDFSRPFVPVPAKPDQQTLNINLYTNPIPFAQYDWSKPVGIRGQPDQVYTDLVLQSFSTPFVQTDWSKGSTSYIRLDQIYPNIILLQPVQVPFFPVDYSKPRTVSSVPSPAMGSNQNLFSNPQPFNQYDWTKLWSVKPIASDQNTLPNIAVLNPTKSSTPLGIFGWVDWGWVKSPVIIIPDQDSLPNLVLYLTPPPIPPVEVTHSGKWRWLEGVQQLNNLDKLLPSVKEAAAILSSAGGHARAQALTAKQRSTIASNAAKVRWR